MNITEKPHESDAIDDHVLLLDPNIIDEDVLIIKAEQIMNNAGKSVSENAKAIDQLIELLTDLPDAGTRELFIDELSKKFNIRKKVLNEKLKTAIHEKQSAKHALSVDAVSSDLPPGVDVKLFLKHGFYQHKNKLYFKTAKGIRQGANFMLHPLFHVKSLTEAKRLFRIKNEHGATEIIELMQKDLTSLQAFKLRVESLGNFLWVLGEAELARLKGWLYANTETCQEIKQLGYQKEGFWAWSNGIFNHEFKPVDEYGIIKYKNKSYYIPAYSSIYKHETDLFVAERKFLHKPGGTSLAELAAEMKRVFGDNAIVSFSYLLASCFRDIIVKRFGFFPLLNFFGPKATGKTELAACMLHFFGHAHPGPNINNTTKPALADHVARFSNALCHIDEYKNNIEYEKIEFLKGIWDGTGRTRMNMDKDKKMETSSVQTGVIITGQEMPTADIALFSRMVFLTFHRTEFTDEEKRRFGDLKELFKKGVTHITQEILEHREYFSENFFDNYELATKELNDKLADQTVIDRIFRNWAVLLASFRTLKNKLQIPYDYEKYVQLTCDLVLRQNRESGRTDEVAGFWEIVGYLVKEGEIEEESDFRVVSTAKLKTDKHHYEWEDPCEVLLLNHTRIFDKYRKHGAQTRDNVLSKKNMEYYLAHSKEYLGRMRSCRFAMNNHLNGDTEFEAKPKAQVTTAMAFSHDHLKNKYGLSVTLSSDYEDDFNEKEDTDTLPF